MTGPRAMSAAGAAFVIAASVLWGTTGTAASFLPADVSPLATGAATMGIGGLLLFAVFARSATGLLRHPASRRWVIFGSVAVAVYPLAFYSGMATAGVAVGTVVSLGSAPVFAAIIEWVWERAPLTRWWVLGTTACIGGSILLAAGVTRGANETREGHSGLAVGLALLAGLAYAFYTYAARRVMGAGQDVKPTAAMGVMFGGGGLLLVPVLLSVGSPLLQSPTTLGIAAYLALVPMFVAYVLFALGLRSVQASTATSLSLAEPAVAALLAVLVVGERVSGYGYLGIVAIALGILVVTGVFRRGRPSFTARIP